MLKKHRVIMLTLFIDLTALCTTYKQCTNLNVENFRLTELLTHSLFAAVVFLSSLHPAWTLCALTWVAVPAFSPPFTQRLVFGSPSTSRVGDWLIMGPLLYNIVKGASRSAQNY